MWTNQPLVRRIVELALEEDLGTGDLTTDLSIPEGATARAEVVAKEPCVLAGLPVAREVIRQVDPDLVVQDLAADGDPVEPGQAVLRASGRAASLLTAERTLLNFVMRLSGVATATREFAKALEGTQTTLLDTRKTTPGLRVLEKYAVRVGGARNHRMNLAGGVLIKNNHLALWGADLKAAIRRARREAPALTRVEVEVRTMEEVRRAIEAGAEMLLLDHMTVEQVAEVVAYCRWKVTLEVSGDMTPAKAREMALAGVDFVSAGSITHQARWRDFSMTLTPLPQAAADVPTS
ncbi:MAG TPA: carboxylating nicotinate-nucleotide diphosphorylase [Myxococcota bacterium]|nr:carboxylating nicotinate-nucleotide diphosphorylase [Myxococcota bacterium]HQK50664.1 carboxylating nicotinate-nucleotide diphosphorylase [Myxococcota bacterium]